MSDKPIITVGATTLKLQMGLQPTDQQWCELAHVRAFSADGVDITAQVQIDAQQVQFDQVGTYPVQAFVSDPKTQKIAGQMFQVQLVSLDAPIPEPRPVVPEPEVKATPEFDPEPEPQTPPKRPFKKVSQPEVTPKAAEQSDIKSKKAHRHFMWTVLTLVLGILLMWLLIYIFSGGNNATATNTTTPAETTSQVEETTSETDGSTTESASDMLGTLLQKVQDLF